MRLAQADYRRRLRETVYAAYGGFVCTCCGEREPTFLSLDHINNDGAEHRRELKHPDALYGWLIKNGFPPIVQVLCMNCNFGKQRNGGTCPHQGTK